MSITKHIDGVTFIPPSYLREICPPPKSIKWELVDSCNYNCSFCGIRGREKPGRTRMDLDFFKRASKEAYDAGVEECGLFFIGESTMDPALLMECLKWAKSLGYYTFLTTNGSLCDPMLSGELMANGLDSLKFSINASNAQQFKQVMGVKPSLFDKSLANLKAAYELRNEKGYKTKIYASSIMFNGEQQERMEALLSKQVVPYVDEHYYLPCFSEMQSPSAERNRSMGWKPNAGNVGRLDAMRDPLPCWSVLREGHVRVDGSLSACCFGADDKFDMGNLYEMSFMEAWNSEAFQALRKKHLSGDVRGTACEACIHG